MSDPATKSATASGPAPALLDPWALLGLPREAAVTEEAIRNAFQVLAAASHPDNSQDSADREQSTAQFTRLNEARAVLQSLPARLRALRFLEFPDAPAAPSAPDGDLMEIFSRAGTALQAAQKVSAAKRAASSALARALLAKEEMRAQEALQEIGTELQQHADALAADLSRIDQHLSSDRIGTLDLLTKKAQRAAFLEKWQGQVRTAFQGLLM